MASTAQHGWPMVRLGEVLRAAGVPEKISSPETESFITVKMHGEGAVQRNIGAGKTPAAFTGYRVKEGQFIYSRIDARNGAFALIPSTLDGAVVSKDFPIFEIDESRCMPKYLHYFATSGILAAKAKALSFGATNRQRVKEEAFLRFEIPLPPLAEQRRIATILDEARVQTNQSDEAGTLLNTMTSSWLSTRSQSVPGVKLSELGTFRGGMTPSKKNPEFWGGDVYWFTTKDLKFGEVDESEERITDRALEETSASLIGEPSIAFSLRGMSLAHRLPMSCIPGEATVNQDLKAFVPNQSMDRDVIFHLVKLKEMELLSKVSTSAHGTKKLDLRHLKDLEIPDPSGEFGFEVRRVLEQIRDMQEQIRRRQAASAKLFQALSTRAFQGEL
ncbi:restriction endonuclease subunit S [Corynebacterium hiratae]|uniref:Type I restriction modification DNA specificity domain-containing protein n=1 Tax=Corynebacterium hiratae TaxID=3139423 RepID=A0A553FMM4_9CORY|nr:restriction endonuclease subunit S [Corynebacterium aurimucosum]TRX58501.1 hypothetical protein FNY97_13210 [Corynebacterium aurimucosum]